METHTPLVEISFSKTIVESQALYIKVQDCILYDLAILFMGCFTEMHAYVHKNFHNSTVNNSSQLEKPIVHLPQKTQTNRCIYTMKYHATIKVNELLLHARTWMNLTVC